MHPDPAFRPDSASSEELTLYEALIDEVRFGMVFAATPDGLRVAHVPLVSTGAGTLHFHLSRRNALSPHIDGMSVLAVINGPEGYVSPRWYRDQAQVPTWNYVALEMEGRARKMDSEELPGLMEALSDRQEAQVIGGTPWSMDKMPADRLQKMLGGIVGFAITVDTWRPTFKLSQNKSVDERNRVVAGLEAQGAHRIAQAMRTAGGAA